MTVIVLVIVAVTVSVLHYRCNVAEHLTFVPIDALFVVGILSMTSCYYYWDLLVLQFSRRRFDEDDYFSFRHLDRVTDFFYCCD
jgi:hypothetical protein